MAGILVMTLLFGSCRQAQVPAAEIPSVVRNTVIEKYPGVTEMEWEMLNDLYQVEVELNDGMEAHLQLDSGGRLLAEKHELPLAKVPGTILSRINVAYPGSRVDDVERVVKQDGIYYQVDFDRPDMKKVFTVHGEETPNMNYWD